MLFHRSHRIRTRYSASSGTWWLQHNVDENTETSACPLERSTARIVRVNVDRWSRGKLWKLGRELRHLSPNVSPVLFAPVDSFFCEVKIKTRLIWQSSRILRLLIFLREIFAFSMKMLIRTVKYSLKFFLLRSNVNLIEIFFQI